MRQLKLVLGTLFGAGLLPKAPGTWGSLFSLPLIYCAFIIDPRFGIAALCAAASLLSLWTSGVNTETFGDDPGEFVLDETAGQAAVFIFTSFHHTVSVNLSILLTGFVLFRIFDILKPLGIDRLQKLPGKFGILVDDLVAGVYALICLELLKLLLGSLLL